MEDKTLECIDCHKNFVWTVGEQEFYAQRGFENEPKRCPECRKANKMKKQQNRHDDRYNGHNDRNNG